MDLQSEELDLEIKDYRPHKANPDSKVLKFSDPHSNPRFPPSATRTKGRADTDDEQGEGEEAVLDLDVAGAVDRLKGPRGQLGVEMKKMRGREEAVDVHAMVNGSVDKELAMEVGQERANGVVGGIEHMKRRKDKGMVDFDKQTSRRTKLEDEKEKIVFVNEETSRTLYQTDADGHYGEDMGQGKGRKGLAWDKQIGRERNIPSERRVVDANGESVFGEELDIAPDPNASSR